jgi:hypothetical protein
MNAYCWRTDTVVIALPVLLFGAAIACFDYPAHVDGIED